MPSTIPFPKIGGVYSFERLLLEQQKKRPPKGDPLVFDLRDSTWIGTLEASLLYDWVAQSVGGGHAVTVKAQNDADPSLSQYLTRIGFLDALESIGAKVETSRSTKTRPELAAFQRFVSREELLAYEAAVTDPERRERILGGGNDCSLIATGDFAEIVLHELGENSFSHGGGTSVRYFISENRGRRSADAFSFSPDVDYLEIVVSDSGVGLITKLKSALPQDWEPPAADSAKLSSGGRICAFALEFSATSDQDARRARLLEQLKSTDDFSDVVPTGLFYVASLVRHYGGQLLIRTGETSFLLDCTSGLQTTIRENPLGKKGAKVRGTHIVVRVPRHGRQRTVQAPRQKVTGALDAVIALEPQIVLLAEVWQLAKQEPADFLVRMESTVEGIFSSRKSASANALVLLADGFQPDTKTAAWILAWLGAIPRRTMSLLVCGLSSELFAAAQEQSALITKIRSLSGTPTIARRFQAWQAYSICSQHDTQQLLFGEDKCAGEMSPLLQGVYKTSLKEALRRIISAKPIKHLEQIGRYYLIEGKYYTERFYEIRQLTTRDRNPVGVVLVATYLRMILRQHGVNTVFCISESLNDVITELSIVDPGLKCHLAGAGGGGFLQAAAGALGGSKLMILTDVVCTGSQFQNLLKRAPRIEDVLLFTLVDAREAEHKKYFPLGGPERAYSIPLLSILETTISAIKDLPYISDPDILIIDKVTHSPTPKDGLQNIYISPDAVIAESGASEALFQGHIVVEDVHYVDLIVLPKLLSSLHEELSRSWGRMLQSIAESGIEAKHTSVFYFSEGRGWEHLVDKFMSTKGVAECRSIDRARLEAPPANFETSIRGQAVLLVLPVIASGETLRRCLEYFSRVRTSARNDSGSPAIFVCVALGRASSSELSFYQGIRRFKDSRVHIEVMAYLPLPAYRGKTACPICQLMQTVRGNASRLRGRNAANLVETSAAKFQIIDVRFEEGEPKLSGKLSASSPVRAGLRALFNEAERDIVRRKDLAEKLDTDENKRLFVEMVGSHCDMLAFSRDVLRVRLYSRFDVLRDYVLELIEQAKRATVPLVALLGAHILFPEALENEMKSLTISACRRGDIMELGDLFFLTMTDPIRYGPLFSVGILAASHWCNDIGVPRGLIEELASYQIWTELNDADAIESFEKVLWLLRRSTDWGSGIEALRAALHMPSISHRELTEKFRDFEFKGINTVLRNMAMIESVDNRNGLLTAITVEGQDPTVFTSAILESTSNIRVLLENASEISEIAGALRTLDDAGKALLSACDQLFTNPLSALREVEKALSLGVKWPSLSSDRFRLVSDVADDQPGILFGLKDLTGCLEALFENAAAHVKSSASAQPALEGHLWIRLDFVGYDRNLERAILEVSDNIPYVRPLIPAGGLKNVKAICAKYGALVDYAPERDRNPNLRICFYFRTDTSRRAT